MNNISILGCGWLGLPLAESLIANGFSVKGSTTSPDKLALLKNNGVQPFLISVSENDLEGDTENFLKASSLLIIDIPPKSAHSDFTKKVNQLIPIIEKAAIPDVLFISSISVYADNNGIVDEATPTNPVTDNGRQLVAAELFLKENRSFRTTVIRFGGLIGCDRHPVKHLAGRKNVENPYAPINLIHQQDCIGIILKIIENKAYGKTFNAVSPFHPSRQEYYIQKAKRLNLSPPEFDQTKPSVGKTISSQKVENELGYAFTVPEL